MLKPAQQGTGLKCELRGHKAWYVTGALSQSYLLGEVGEAAPPSVDVVGGLVSGMGRGTGLAIGGGGGGGNIGVGRNGLCTLP